MAATTFRHLFTPFTVGGMTVRNRIVVPGHATLFMPWDGLPTDRMLHYWVAKARGGVGLIITHVHNVLPRHTGAPPTAMQTDAMIPAYRRVVDAVHAEGVKFLVQLNHMGAEGSSRPFGGVLARPSAVPSRRAGLIPAMAETPHEMTLDEIAAVVAAFRHAARSPGEPALALSRLNLFRSEEDARRWARFDPAFVENLQPVAAWIERFSAERFRARSRPDYVSWWRAQAR